MTKSLVPQLFHRSSTEVPQLVRGRSKSRSYTLHLHSLPPLKAVYLVLPLGLWFFECQGLGTIYLCSSSFIGNSPLTWKYSHWKYHTVRE